MTTPITHSNAGNESDPTALAEHLERELSRPERTYTLDMEDTPEKPALTAFGALARALQCLNREILDQYRRADSTAIDRQAKHRRLARIAIVTGGLAVALAVLQLAVTRGSPQLTTLTATFEGVAVAAGLIAVVLGLRAKYDHQWLIQRHRAERLRMLKFRALGWPALWCGSFDSWNEEITRQVRAIAAISTIDDVKKWAESEEAEPFHQVPTGCTESESDVRACAIYYRYKRALFQAAYFGRQSSRYRHQVRPVAHLGLRLFFGSIAVTLFHFGADFLAHRCEGAGETGAFFVWQAMATSALTLAVLLPILSFCVRAWIGAFEHTRSASLFEAKAHALTGISESLKRDETDLAETMRHISHIEHFLEHEHREWLRLLLDAEWFL